MRLAQVQPPSAIARRRETWARHLASILLDSADYATTFNKRTVILDRNSYQGQRSI